MTGMFNRLPFAGTDRLAAILSNGLTTVGLLAMVLNASRAIGEQERFFLVATIVLVWGCIVAELAYRFWLAPAGTRRGDYLASASGLIAARAIINR